MPQVLDLRKKQKENSGNPPPKRNFSRPAPLVPPEVMAKPQNQQNPRIAWEAPSFYLNPQKRYLTITIIFLIAGGGGLLIFNGDKLTSIFLILSSLVLALYSSKKPEILKVLIDQRGITIKDTVYYYKDLRSFWIHYEPGSFKELSLESKKWYLPYTKISIENKDPLLIRSLLLKFLPEKEHEKALTDVISHKIGL